MHVQDKVALVTGGARGVGRAIAERFASSGARVLIADSGVAPDGSAPDGSVAEDAAEAIRTAGGQAIGAAIDVSSRAGAAEAVQATVDGFGRLDILVHAAGVLRDRSLLKMDEESLDAVMKAHLHAAFWTNQAAAKQLIDQGEGGRIINLCGVAGLRGTAGQSNYAAAEGGIHGLTRTAAIELQRHRITVNAIAPLAKTRLTEHLPMFSGTESLTPEHVAPVALFLGSELARDRTGMVIAVAGAQIYVFKVVESHGRFHEGEEPWSPEAIAEQFDAIARF